MVRDHLVHILTLYIRRMYLSMGMFCNLFTVTSCNTTIYFCILSFTISIQSMLTTPDAGGRTTTIHTLICTIKVHKLQRHTSEELGQNSTSSEGLDHVCALHLLQLPKQCNVSGNLGHNSTRSKVLDHVRVIFTGTTNSLT